MSLSCVESEHGPDGMRLSHKELGMQGMVKTWSMDRGDTGRSNEAGG